MERPHGGNCWTRKTALEIGFILILIISVPILITLITVYAILIVTRGEFGGENETDTTATAPEQQRYMERIAGMSQMEICFALCGGPDAGPNCYQDMVEDKVLLPFMASISEALFVDDPSEHRYKCAAVVITYKYVMTSSECLEVNSVSQLYLRAGSNYWFKGGTVHEIRAGHVLKEKPRPFPRLALVELSSPLPRAGVIRAVNVATKLTAKLDTGEMVMWRSNDSLQLKYRRRELPMEVRQVNMVKCPAWATGGVVCVVEKVEPAPQLRCSFYRGAVLVLKNELVGVRVVGRCDLARSVHVFEMVRAVWKWVKHLTGRDLKKIAAL